MVQQLEYNCKNAKVYFRITPNVDVSWDYLKIFEDKRTLYVRCLQDFLVGNKDIIPNYWCFKTDGIFYNDSQQQIYEEVVPGLIEHVLGGSDAVILSYGNTGTGKSLTTSAIENSYEDRGIIPRVIEDLFKLREENKNKMRITYKISFVEATRTHIYDLLNDNIPAYDVNSMKHMNIYRIDDLETTLISIFKGEGRKTFVKQSCYKNSHAAHSVLTIFVSCRLNNEIKPVKTISKLHVVDLAGVDTVGNKSCFYKNVQQIGMANVCKTQLEQFVLILIENITQQILVKQRLNALIQYLGESLSRSSILRFIGHIRSGKEDLMMSLSMLRFGTIIRGLKPKKLGFHIKDSKQTKIKYLEASVQEMKKEMQIQAMISNNDMRVNLTQDRLQHMQQLAEDYLRDKINELVIINFSDVNTILKVFKDKFLASESQKALEVEEAYRQAYDKIITTVKQTPSRGNSKKLPNIKSKDSLLSSQHSKVSKRSISAKGSKVSNDSKEKTKKKDGSKMKITSNQSISVADSKNSRTSSKVMRKSLKKKSSTISETKEEGDDADVNPLADDIPPFKQAWSDFTLNDEFGYSGLKTELDENEQAARKINLKYLNEVRDLQDMKQTLDLKRESFLKAQMANDLSGSLSVDDDGNIVLSDQEKVCLDSVKKFENQLVQVQENILTIQTDLKLQLDICKQIRKAINDRFDLYCKENFKTVLPNLHEVPSCTIDTDRNALAAELENNDEQLTEKELADCYNNLMKYESLKKMMHKQIEKMTLREIQNKRWIRSCKS